MQTVAGNFVQISGEYLNRKKLKRHTETNTKEIALCVDHRSVYTQCNALLAKIIITKFR